METPVCSNGHKPLRMLAMFTLKSPLPLFWQCVWIEREQWANLNAPICDHRIQNPDHPDFVQESRGE